VRKSKQQIRLGIILWNDPIFKQLIFFSAMNTPMLLSPIPNSRCLIFDCFTPPVSLHCYLIAEYKIHAKRRKICEFATGSEIPQLKVQIRLERTICFKKHPLVWAISLPIQEAKEALLHQFHRLSLKYHYCVINS